MTAAAVIVAAGQGTRIGKPKQLLPLGGLPILLWSCRTFGRHPAIREIVTVIPPELAVNPPAWLRSAGVHWTAGGTTRRVSAGLGIEALATDPEIILVHDAARPFASAETIDRVLAAAQSAGAAVPILALVDTVKRLADERAVGTVDRVSLGRAQTPQGFRAAWIREAHRWATRTGTPAPDDAALCEMRGHPVRAVAGERWNLKITTPDDLALAEWLIQSGRIRVPTGDETAGGRL